MVIFNRRVRKDLRQGLRKEMSKTEIGLWMGLQGRQLDGFKFRRQHGIGPYVVDFYCAEARLAIELDGDSHSTPEARQYDASRDKFISKQNVKVVRFTNREVYENFEGVLQKIRELLGSRTTASSPEAEARGGNPT